MKNQKAKTFFENIKNKEIAICGIGINNTPVILQFASYGAKVTACDKRNRKELGDIAELFEKAGVNLSLGEGYLDDLTSFGKDMILRTPGMKPHLKEFREAREKGIKVTSDMEIFLSLCPAPVTGITGSDGKTTTTSIISGLFEKEGYVVHTGGNIGRSLLPIIDEIQKEDQVVVELSSFQLMFMKQSPSTAVVTNLSPNHLDWHTDMEEYIEAKKNIVKWQRENDRTVLNLDDEIIESFGSLSKNKDNLFYFSRKQKPLIGGFLNKNRDIFIVDKKNEPVFVMNADDIWLRGEHNVENYIAAFCAVFGKVKPEIMAEFAKNYTGVEHRCEFVREVGGVKWYNDSIASSPSRTVAGLKSFDEKVILISGGYDKKIPYEPLGKEARGKVSKAILLGATAQKIEAAIKKYSPNVETVRVENLKEAVKLAETFSKAGDTVLFSPASASFDMYRNFEERGKHFKILVSDL